MTLRILVADDHPAIALAIRSLLRSHAGWEVCAEVTTSDALFRALDTERPDILVTDYHMPGGKAKDGLRMLGCLRRGYPSLNVIVLTMITNPLILKSMLDIPVQGLLLKDSPLDELVHAILHIRRGSSYTGKSAARILAESNAHKPYSEDRNGFSSLSVREAEVLRLYLSGRSVTQIADVLSRSVKTVSRQKNCAMQKLGAANDRELFDFAVRQDIVFPSPGS
jgi:two-component system capsular synthesis response regulator RcsB